MILVRLDNNARHPVHNDRHPEHNDRYQSIVLSGAAITSLEIPAFRQSALAVVLS